MGKCNFCGSDKEGCCEFGKLPQPITYWQSECHRWRGNVLTGEFAHYCWEWDGLPVDETCCQTMKDDKGQLHEVGEWPCGCYFTKEDGSVWELTEPLRKLTKEEVEAKWPNP